MLSVKLPLSDGIMVHYCGEFRVHLVNCSGESQ